MKERKCKVSGSPWLTLVITAELFLMLLMSFPRLDDLTWGSSVGMDRLSTWFAGYNGRYVGNLVVLLLTRLPAILRAGLELVVLCGLLYCAYRLLPKKGMFCFFLLALLALPLEVYAQSVVWTAGFANYVTSAAVMLFELHIYDQIVIREKRLSKAGCVAFAAVCFFGQLIVENTTLYTVVLAGAALVYGWVRTKKAPVPALAGLIATVCGALLMFSNSSYHSALVGDGGNYKTISLSFLELWKKFEDEVIPHLVRNNHVLNLALSAVLLLLWLTGSREKGRGKRAGCAVGAALSAFFCYDAVDNSTWLNVVPCAKTLYALAALAYGAYIVVTILVYAPDRREKALLLTLALSQVVLTAPLVPAQPLSARCFFQNGLLWCLLLAHLLQILLERHGLSLGEGSVVAAQVVCVFFLAFTLCGQMRSWRVQAIRQEITQTSLAQGSRTIVLPEVPWSGKYCYGANISNQNDYWLTNYKRYYHIPFDVELEFMDYYKWTAQYGK